MASPLTATAVKNARPANARRELPDGACPGLNLCIEPSGTKGLTAVLPGWCWVVFMSPIKS
jgi:hypothetical protein